MLAAQSGEESPRLHTIPSSPEWQAYESKESAKKGISSVQTNAPGAALVDLTSTTK